MNFETLKIAAVDLWDNARDALHNLRCRFRPARVDYVVFSLSGALP